MFSFILKSVADVRKLHKIGFSKLIEKLKILNIFLIEIASKVLWCKTQSKTQK